MSDASKQSCIPALPKPDGYDRRVEGHYCATSMLEFAAIAAINARRESLDEIERLRLAERLNVETVAGLQQERDELRIKYANMFSTLNSKQAKIDALMLEFCPGEMSASQRNDWAKSQRASEPPSSPLHHCNICGGEVDLSNATRPTEKVGRGPKFKQTDAPDDGAMRGVAVTKEGSATCSRDSSP